MYSTPLNILYLVLSIGFALLVIFLVVTLCRINKILKNINKVTDKAKDTVDLINHYLWQPIKIMMMVMEKSKEFGAKQAKKTTKRKKK